MTIIGPGRLNGRVRNGNGCDPAGMITWKNFSCLKELVASQRWAFASLAPTVPLAT
jgi:hypothetical protein